MKPIVLIALVGTLTIINFCALYLGNVTVSQEPKLLGNVPVPQEPNLLGDLSVCQISWQTE